MEAVLLWLLLLHVFIIFSVCGFVCVALGVAVESQITLLVSNSHKIMSSTFQTTPKKENKGKIQYVKDNKKLVE